MWLSDPRWASSLSTVWPLGSSCSLFDLQGSQVWNLLCVFDLHLDIREGVTKWLVFNHIHILCLHVFEQRAHEPKIRLCLIKASLAITIYSAIVAICSELAGISLACVHVWVCVCVCVFDTSCRLNDGEERSTKLIRWGTVINFTGINMLSCCHCVQYAAFINVYFTLPNEVEYCRVISFLYQVDHLSQKLCCASQKANTYSLPVAKKHFSEHSRHS